MVTRWKKANPVTAEGWKEGGGVIYVKNSTHTHSSATKPANCVFAFHRHTHTGDWDHRSTHFTSTLRYCCVVQAPAHAYTTTRKCEEGVKTSTISNTNNKDDNFELKGGASDGIYLLPPSDLLSLARDEIGVEPSHGFRVTWRP